MLIRNTALVAALIPALLMGCASDAPQEEASTLQVDSNDYIKGSDGKSDSSAVAIFLDFAFEGKMITDSSWSLERQIEDQLLYTIGHLNEDRSVGRLDKLKLTNVQSEQVDGRTHVTYDASLLVAWGQKNNVPSEYEFLLPLDVSRQALEDFTEKYSHDCVEYGAHDVTSGSMWYYYRPQQSRCRIADEDIIRANAAVTISDVNTTGKYPEYHRVWEDDALKVVAIFGKYEDDTTSNSDAGIAAYNRFIRTMDTTFEQFETTTIPEALPRTAGTANPDITFVVDLGEGRTVEVVALLVDNIRTAGQDFDDRYESLTGDADLIAYNGHAGLGANIRAMANKGNWVTGQYSIVFMDGCDTYAYVDTALNDARSAINSDDPNGTKYLDILTNAMPAFFREMSNNTEQLIIGLMDTDNPKTFEQIFESIDDSQVILVSGEEDNEFVPGMDDGGDVEPAWEGLEEAGTVERAEMHRFETPRLAAGEYVFEMFGSGDADLYMRVGNEPTEYDFDCRPYKWGSNEICSVELSSEATIHLMVQGYDELSAYTLVGKKL